MSARIQSFDTAWTMKPFALFLLTFAMLSLPGCRSVPANMAHTLSTDEHMQGLVITAVALPLYLAGVRTPEGPAILATGSDAEIRKAAAADARTDIDAGNPRICYAGTRGIFAVGVPQQHLRRVEAFERVPLPSGCTNPLALRALVYAEAYNAEVMRSLPASLP
jgi:hypothetical protein